MPFSRLAGEGSPSGGSTERVALQASLKLEENKFFVFLFFVVAVVDINIKLRSDMSKIIGSQKA